MIKITKKDAEIAEAWVELVFKLTVIAAAFKYIFAG